MNTEKEIPTVRFDFLVKEWLSSHERQWKESSRVRYANLLRCYLLPFFGPIPVEEITREKVVSLCGHLLRSGGVNTDGLSPKTVSDILSVLKSILRYAERNFDMRALNLRDLSIRQQPKPLRVFSPEEQRRLTAFLCRDSRLDHLGILLSLYTGLRIGELCALKWDSISLEERCLHVRATMQRLQTFGEGSKTRVVVTPPKSASSQRSIPLPDFLIALLSPAARPGDCFFLTGTRQHMEPRTMENRFHAVLRACGIDGASFHTCRHSFATRCVELGFDVKSLSEILGHASVTITMNRYVHPSMDFKRQNMNRLSSLLE